MPDAERMKASIQHGKCSNCGEGSRVIELGNAGEAVVICADCAELAWQLLREDSP